MLVCLFTSPTIVPSFGQSHIRSLPLDTTVVEKLFGSDDTPDFDYRYRLKWPIEIKDSPVLFHSEPDSLPVLLVRHQEDSIWYTEYWPSGSIKREYVEVRDRKKVPPFRLTRIKDYCENGILRVDFDWSLSLQFVRTYYCNGQLRSRFVQVFSDSNPVGVVGPYEFWYPNGQKQFEEFYDENGISVDGPRKWSEDGEVIEQ